MKFKLAFSNVLPVYNFEVYFHGIFYVFIFFLAIRCSELFCRFAVVYTLPFNVCFCLLCYCCHAL